MTFGEVSAEYKRLREQERKSLVEFLSKYLPKNDTTKEKLCVVSGGRSGKGITKYTSGRRIAEYDLSNWKWVEITDGGDFDCIVSLNMPDVDPSSGNSHFLFDRIGLLVFYHIDNYYYETNIYTDIDLPLDNRDDKGNDGKEDEKDKEKIAQLVIEQFENYCKKKADMVQTMESEQTGG